MVSIMYSIEEKFSESRKIAQSLMKLMQNADMPRRIRYLYAAEVLKLFNRCQVEW